MVGTILQQSPYIDQPSQYICQVNRNDRPVLVRGESGSGDDSPTRSHVRPFYLVFCLLPIQLPDCRFSNMSSPHRLLIQLEGQVVLEVPLTSSMEVGRQRQGEPEPFVVLAGGGE